MILFQPSYIDIMKNFEKYYFDEKHSIKKIGFVLERNLNYKSCK